MRKPNLFLKVVLLGDPDCGKIDVRNRFMGRGFREEHLMTIGADFATWDVEIDAEKVTFQLWDLAGQNDLRSVLARFFRGASGGFCFFDITRMEQLLFLKDQISDLWENTGQGVVPITLIGIDRNSDRKNQIPQSFIDEYIEELSQETQKALNIDVNFYRVNPKTGFGVNEAVSNLGRQIFAAKQPRFRAAIRDQFDRTILMLVEREPIRLKEEQEEERVQAGLRQIQLEKEQEEVEERERQNQIRLQKEREEAQRKETERISSLITNILGILQQIQSNIPVQLSRIAQLTNNDAIEVENYLKQILVSDTQLGEYHELEQVFIRRQGEITDNQIKQSAAIITSRQFSAVDALQTCPNCKEAQSVLIRRCVNCKHDLMYCQVCKQGFTESQQQINCPHCENTYHRNHLFAYIQSHGKCAVCKEGLTLGQFEM